MRQWVNANYHIYTLTYQHIDYKCDHALMRLCVNEQMREWEMHKCVLFRNPFKIFYKVQLFPSLLLDKFHQLVPS